MPGLKHKRVVNLNHLITGYLLFVLAFLLAGSVVLYGIIRSVADEHERVYQESLNTFFNADLVISYAEPARFLMSDVLGSLQRFSAQFELLTIDPDYDISILKDTYSDLNRNYEKLTRYSKTVPEEYLNSLRDNLLIILDISEELFSTQSSNARQQLFRDSLQPIEEVTSRIKDLAIVIDRQSLDARRQIQANIISSRQESRRFDANIDQLITWIVIASMFIAASVVFSLLYLIKVIRDRLAVLEQYADQIANENFVSPPFRVNDATGRFAVKLALMGRKIRNLIKSVRMHSDRTIRALEAMEEIANKDALTGLYNRRSFHKLLQEAISVYHRQNQKIIVLFIDLDNFKRINDTMGHDVGDELLKVIASRLDQEIRAQDYLARLGGDEFAIIAFQHTDNGLQLLHRIKKSITRPVMLNGREILITVSTGVAEINDEITSPVELLRRADLAMYHAKAKGRNTHQHFNLRLQKQIDDEISLSSDIGRALEEKEFELYFQPQYCLRTRKIKGAEALIRWHQPEHGWVPPTLFIPIAEKTGIIGRVDEWVVLNACKKAAYLKAQNTPMRISINISPNQFINRDFLPLVESSLDKYELEPSLLEVEITERMLVKDFKRAKNTLEGLRHLGVAVALDDFGTGYSSLNYLRQLPLDVLKIDRNFVANMLDFKKERAIVKTIIDLGIELEMRVIAEGVEKEEEARFLDDSGCHFAQGYFFSRPVPLKKFLDLTRSESNVVQFSRQ